MKYAITTALAALGLTIAAVPAAASSPHTVDPAGMVPTLSGPSSCAGTISKGGR